MIWLGLAFVVSLVVAAFVEGMEPPRCWFCGNVADAPCNENRCAR